MRVVSITPRPEAQSIEPALMFEVVFAFRRGVQVPLDCALLVQSEDGRLLGVAHPSVVPSTASPADALPLDASTPNTPSAGESTWSVQAVLGLTPKGLDHLEGLRAKHRKGDVVLGCKVEAHSLTSKAVIAPLMDGPRRDAKEPEQLVLYREPAPGLSFYSQRPNLWVLSGEGSRTFLGRETLYHPATVTISSSDWVHEYATPWRATRYMVVELPQPEVLTTVTNIEERVNKAIAATKKASDDFARGEWGDVIADLRPVWEVLRDATDVQDLLGRDGYPPAAIEAFSASIDRQFEFASKFLHVLDKNGQKTLPEIRASKEDALVCYAFATSLLNLVTRKALRLRTT